MANIVLGLDFGMRHIGLAIGQVITNTATPLDSIKAQDGIPEWDLIQQVIDEWGVDALIVGLPYNMDGTEQPMTALARKFGRRLEARFHLPVHFVDERLTSYEAKKELTGHGSTKKRPKNVDSVAARIIVESWLRE